MLTELKIFALGKDVETQLWAKQVRNIQSVIQVLNNNDDWYMHNDACYISYRPNFVNV